MKKKKKAEEEDLFIVVGSNRSCGFPNESVIQCEICKEDTYFSDVWDDVKYKFVCMECAVTLRLLNPKEAIITDKTSKRLGVPKEHLRKRLMDDLGIGEAG